MHDEGGCMFTFILIPFVLSLNRKTVIASLILQENAARVPGGSRQQGGHQDQPGPPRSSGSHQDQPG